MRFQFTDHKRVKDSFSGPAARYSTVSRLTIQTISSSSHHQNWSLHERDLVQHTSRLVLPVALPHTASFGDLPDLTFGLLLIIFPARSAHVEPSDQISQRQGAVPDNNFEKLAKDQGKLARIISQESECLSPISLVKSPCSPHGLVYEARDKSRN